MNLPEWRRTILAVAVVLAIAVVALAWVTKGLIDRNRSHLLAEFSVEQSEHLREVTHAVERDLDDLADRLLFATRLVATARSEESRTHATGSLLHSSRAFRGVLATGPWGESPSFRHSTRDADMLDELRRACQGAGSRAVAVSRRLGTGDDDLLRVLAAAHDGAAIAALVDLAPVLDHLRTLRAGDQLLVLGPHGKPTPISSPAIAATIRSMSDHPTLLGALERMRAGETGTLVLDDARARELQLGPGDAIVAFAPIAIEGGVNWSVATLRSMAPLRAHERAVFVRFGSVAVIMVLVLAAVGAYVIAAGRRTSVLRERVQHNEELAAVHAQLLRAEKLATVGALAAGIAHEIGTPLGVVRGRAEYVAGKLPADHPQADSLRIIAEQVDRIARTIRALLDFSRIKPSEIGPVDLTAAVGQCLELLRYEIDRRRIRIALAIPAATTVEADADQLQQVLINLLLNACAACDDSGEVEVRARHRSSGAELPCDHVAIEVLDNGVGVQQEDVERAFDPFFTTKKPGEGTGLGLAIVTQIVHDHGGSVRLRPREPRGSVAELAWPVSRRGHHG